MSLEPIVDFNRESPKEIVQAASDLYSLSKILSHFLQFSYFENEGLAPTMPMTINGEDVEVPWAEGIEKICFIHREAFFRAGVEPEKGDDLLNVLRTAMITHYGNCRLLLRQYGWNDGMPFKRLLSPITGPPNDGHEELLAYADAQLNELHWVLREIKGDLEAAVDHASNDPPKPQIALTDRQQGILQAMLEQGATSPNNLLSSHDTAKFAEGLLSADGTFRESIKALKDLGLVDTKTGSGGGAWLTELGIETAESL